MLHPENLQLAQLAWLGAGERAEERIDVEVVPAAVAEEDEQPRVLEGVDHRGAISGTETSGQLEGPRAQVAQAGRRQRPVQVQRTAPDAGISQGVLDAAIEVHRYVTTAKREMSGEELVQLVGRRAGEGAESAQRRVADDPEKVLRHPLESRCGLRSARGADHARGPEVLMRVSPHLGAAYLADDHLRQIVAERERGGMVG